MTSSARLPGARDADFAVALMVSPSLLLRHLLLRSIGARIDGRVADRPLAFPLRHEEQHDRQHDYRRKHGAVGYEQIVLDYVKKTAINAEGKIVLDFILPTHCHYDHIGGFRWIINDPDITIQKAYLKPFNPEIHEALTQEPNPNIPVGHVSQLFQKGYCLKGRLLRPAKVIVSAG